MNTTLTNETRHEPSVHLERSALDNARSKPVRRVGLADRAALHLGVALIKWGRRPSPAPSHERRANRLERALSRQARDARISADMQKAALNYALLNRLR